MGLFLAQLLYFLLELLAFHLFFFVSTKYIAIGGVRDENN